MAVEAACRIAAMMGILLFTIVAVVAQYVRCTMNGLPVEGEVDINGGRIALDEGSADVGVAMTGFAKNGEFFRGVVVGIGMDSIVAD